MSLAAGILIDIDHIWDYYLQQGITLKIKEIYLWNVERRFESIFIFFHSLELVFLLWVFISLFKLGTLWIAMAVGITQHMVLDIISNSCMNIFGYFLTFRIARRFRKEGVFR